MGLYQHEPNVSKEEFDAILRGAKIPDAAKEGIQSAVEDDFLSEEDRARREDFARLIADRLAFEAGEDGDDQKAPGGDEALRDYLVAKWAERIAINAGALVLATLIWNRSGLPKVTLRQAFALRTALSLATDVATKVFLNREHFWAKDQLELAEQREASNA